MATETGDRGRTSCQKWQQVLAAGRVSVRADVVLPPDPAGWVVIGRSPRNEGQPSVSRAAERLARARLGTVVLDLPDADAGTQAGLVHVGAANLRDDLARGLPVAYFGAGRAATPGWLAAAGGALDGLMAWNARPRAAWSHLPAVRVPSLLVAGDRRALLAARAARLRLGARPDIVRRPPADVDILASWYRDRLLGRVTALSTYQPKGARRRAVAMAAAAAVAAAPTAALAAGVAAGPAYGIPDFSAGQRLSAAQIGGDTRAGTPQPGTTSGGDYRLAAGQIGGDGKEVKPPHDDPPLIDGLGVRWNINTNVGFFTSSSASGAVSEAGFTHPVAATTLNGGTINAALADAFDGYNALCLDLNNVGGQCNTANMAVYNQNGPGALECSGRQVVTPLRQMGNFQVRRKIFVPSNDGFARWLNIIRNTSAVQQTVRVQTSNNLGSDANTRIVTTSDGDATPELSDTWVTTFQNFSGTTSPDPRLGHVLQGTAPRPVDLAAISFVNGDDNPFWRYSFSIPPGQTAIIMNFATAQATRAAAATESAELASLSNANALSCMTQAEQVAVRNFNLLATPSITTQASAGGPIGTSVTDTATVAGGVNPTGDVTFRLFSDATCTTEVFTSTNAVAGGSATSGSFAPASPGTYYWTAAYSGDFNNAPATSACGATDESVTITPAPPVGTTLTCTPNPPTGLSCSLSDADGLRFGQFKNMTTNDADPFTFACSPVPTTNVNKELLTLGTRYKVFATDCSNPNVKTSWVIRPDGSVRQIT